MRRNLLALAGLLAISAAAPARAQGVCAAGTTHIERIIVQLRTGDDDLRGGNDQVFGQFNRDGRLTPRVSLNGRRRWYGDTTNAYTFTFPGCGIPARSLRYFRLTTNFRGGFDGDNWNLDELILTWEGTGPGGQRRSGDLARAHGYPLKRFTGSDNTYTLSLRPPHP